MGAKKKKTTKRASSRGKPTRSRSVRGLKRANAVDRAGRFAAPLVISLILLAGIVAIGALGYRTATGSNFFDVTSIDVLGTERSSKDAITRIVASNTEKTGVWNADLAVIREKIERLEFVRVASVSMALPSGIRVHVTERVPVAIVRLSHGDYLADIEGTILAPATKAEADIPFVMKGWDETKSANAIADNVARLKLYSKMRDEWQSIGIADRVKEVNVADLRDPKATIEDSGNSILVTLAKDNFGRSLRSAIQAVAGKGEKIKAVNAVGVSPMIEYLGY